MNGTRLALFIVGIALVVIAAFMLFVETGLARWVPLTVAGAGLLLFIGLLVVGFSQKAAPDEHGHGHTTVETIDEHHRH